MAAITYDKDAPGKGAFRRGALVSGAEKIVTGKFDFDSSYPAGGEDISDIFNQFRNLLGIRFDSPSLSAGTGKTVIVDYTNKKLKLVTNAATPAEVADLSDQSGATGLRFIAWGQ